MGGRGREPVKPDRALIAAFGQIFRFSTGGRHQIDIAPGCSLVAHEAPPRRQSALRPATIEARPPVDRGWDREHAPDPESSAPPRPRAGYRSAPPTSCFPREASQRCTPAASSQGPSRIRKHAGMRDLRCGTHLRQPRWRRCVGFPVPPPRSPLTAASWRREHRRVGWLLLYKEQRYAVRPARTPDH